MGSAIEDLVRACEHAFIGDDPAFDLDFEDAEDVSSPGIGITFGMVRKARAELAKKAVDALYPKDVNKGVSAETLAFLHARRDWLQNLIETGRGDAQGYAEELLALDDVLRRHQEITEAHAYLNEIGVPTRLGLVGLSLAGRIAYLHHHY